MLVTLTYGAIAIAIRSREYMSIWGVVTPNLEQPFFVGPKSKNWECLKQLEFIQAGMVIYKCLFKVDIYDQNLQKNIMPSRQKRYRD